MALRTTSYDQLKKMVEGRIRNKIEGDDLDYFDALVNDAARRAYDESSYWPRFLRYEPRTVERGYIADEEDSFYVYGAGTGDANGLYVQSGSNVYQKFSDGVAKYEISIDLSATSVSVSGFGDSFVNGNYIQSGTSGGKPTYRGDSFPSQEISWAFGQWIIFDSVGAPAYASSEDVATPDLVVTWVALSSSAPIGTVVGSSWGIFDLSNSSLLLYSNPSLDSSTVPLDGWVVESGQSLPPLISDLGKVEQIIEVNNSDRFDSSTVSSPRYRDSISTRTTEMINQTAWVAYKAQLDVTYGDGEEGTSSEIPSEWVRFIALDVAYAMQRGGRMSNPNETYGVAFRAVEDALNIALMNVNRENAVNILKSQGNTYFNRDYATR